MLEIRPVTPEEMPLFVERERTGFNQSARPPGGETEPVFIRPEWTLCAFEDGDLATTYAAIPFDVWFNGGKAPMAGVVAVTTQPWYRRRGHLRAVMAEHFRRLHEEGGAPIAILTATMAAIYQRFGYAVVSHLMLQRVIPGDIRFIAPLPVTGRFRRVTPEQLDVIRPLYDALAREQTGWIDRTEEWWRAHVYENSSTDVYGVAYQQEGETAGFIMYMVERKPYPTPGMGMRALVDVYDFVWRTPEAYQALWGYLKGIDLADEIRLYRMPVDDPAPHVMEEPRRLNATLRDFVLGRIVDVARALPLRRYPLAGEIVFEVVDEFTPWNAGRWLLETDGARTEVRRTDRPAEVTLPVATLAALSFGTYSASAAARMGRMEAHDAAALGRWDALWRTERAPSCLDGF